MPPQTIPAFITARADHVAAVGVNGFEEKQLPITIPRQKLDSWCWAAVTEGLERAFGVSNARDQCSVVAAVLGKVCCPAGTNVRDCNKPEKLELALGPILRQKHNTHDTRELAFVRSRLRAGLPLVAFIDWGNGCAGHVVAISGYRRVGAVVDLRVWDPQTGAFADVRIEELRDAYLGKGTWKFTYETQRPLVPNGGIG